MTSNESKRRILNAALNVVAKHSISGTRMHLIAQEAGMSSANLHYHFATKDELLTDLIQQVQQIFTQRRGGAVADCEDTLEGHLRAFFRNKANQIAQWPDYDRVEFDYWVTSQSDEKIRGLLQADFAAWHDDLVKVLRRFCPTMPEAQMALLAHLLISAMKGAAMQYLLSPNFDLKDYFELCLSQTMYSAAPYLTGACQGKSAPPGRPSVRAQRRFPCQAANPSSASSTRP